jgi:ABC-2 type transport system permease protein
VDGIPQAASTQDRAAAFLGGGFLFVTLLVSLAGAAQAAAAREEEASGRLETLLAAPVSRLHWLVGRVAVATVLLLVAGVSAGLSAWLGALVAGERLAVGDLVAAGVNTVPASLVVLGVGILALGARPRWTGAIAYGYVAGAFLLELVGGLFDVAQPLLPLSVFHHVPLVPAADADPWGWAGLVAVAAVAVALGALALHRRDVTAE